MAASGSYVAGTDYRKRVEVGEYGTASLPVNVPDWSKILKRDNNNHHHKENHVVVEDSDDEDGGREDRIPPHEVLARRRTRMTSFSVYEGMGRTLKMRDAIWEKTGFLD